MMSVCLSVCQLAYLKNHNWKLHEISCTCYVVAVARSSSDNDAIRYVLLVLWTTYIDT